MPLSESGQDRDGQGERTRERYRERGREIARDKGGILTADGQSLGHLNSPAPPPVIHTEYPRNMQAINGPPNIRHKACLSNFS